MTGFTARPSLEELIALGRHSKIPVFEDLGSGCLADLAASGVSEPVVAASCAAGVSVVSFSGDKLLGGPQAGIIAGKKEIIERIRRNPLFRALRVDKLTIAALEVTLRAYLRGAFDEIPALRMIRLHADAIGERARKFIAQLQPSVVRGCHFPDSRGIFSNWRGFHAGSAASHESDFDYLLAPFGCGTGKAFTPTRQLHACDRAHRKQTAHSRSAHRFRGRRIRTRRRARFRAQLNRSIAG
jgi:hypothetical protein